MAADDRDRGDAHVVVYLNGVTDAEIGQVVDDVCDALVRRGLGGDRSDEESAVRALVGVKALAFPDFDDEDLVARFLAEHASFAIPDSGASAPSESARERS